MKIHKRKVSNQVITMILIVMTLLILSTSFSSANDNSFLNVARKCHNYLVDNHYRYRKSYGREFPLDASRGTRIDCSGYVSWCIYEYQNGNFEAQTSKWFLSNAKKIYNGKEPDNPEFCIGWKSIKGSDNFIPGDILCYSGHVQIYAGPDPERVNRYLVLNAGSDNSLSQYIQSIKESYFKQAEYAIRIS